MTKRLASVAAALLLAACSPAQGSVAASKTELIVFAAASLTPSFSQLGGEFEAAHPGVGVTFSFDGSSTLVDQLSQGAPADVFASADRPTMERATSGALIAGVPEVFATNALTMIVPRGNPARVTGLDSSLAGAKLVVCADGVPCGSGTTKLAQQLGVALRPVSEETKVTDVRAKVETGQADAGIVYTTDAKLSGDKVEAIPIPRADEARNDYLIGVPASAAQPDLAREFIAFVTGDEGRAELDAAGFGG